MELSLEELELRCSPETGRLRPQDQLFEALHCSLVVLVTLHEQFSTSSASLSIVT
jgi:hypothetical protein